MTGYELLIVRQDWNRATDGDWAEVLGKLPLFSHLGNRRLRKIAQQAQFAEFAPGDTVIATGSRGDSLYVILSGEAMALRKPAARTLRIGDYFGELALLDGEPRSATVVATDQLHVMRLPRRAFLELLEQDSTIARTMLAELGARVRGLERQTAADLP
jgi:CRP/FNR family transcriptional regulator, cyclic AMP receptor protein